MSRFFVLLSLALLFSACAPVYESEDYTENEVVVPVEVPMEELPEEVVEVPEPSPIDPVAPNNPVAPVQDEPVFDPENPDWQLRYRQLYAKYLPQFPAPEMNKPVTLTMKGGRRVQGTMTGLTDAEVQLTVGAGMVAYPADALSPETASHLFAPNWADARAREQGSLEYNDWLRSQQTVMARPTPTPVPYQTARVYNNRKPTEDGRLTDMFVAAEPKNEGPSGKVWQVEKYILDNAAIPNSLRIKAWGPVQKHPKGFKVRVQYSLESAGGLGISHEDMMFFMNSRGRVYQRAAVK